MKSFKQFLIEKTIHWFDLDETLFSHGDRVKIHVKNPEGHVVHSLTNSEYNNHKLPDNHSYDYGNFRSSKEFQASAKPIHKLIRHANQLSKKHKVEIMTARADFDDKDHFIDVMKSHGIDPMKIHVRRAGNLKGKNSADRKQKFMSQLIKTHGYKNVHLYDDSEENLKAFLELKKHHPNVNFHAYHVTPTENEKVKVKKYG